MDERFEKRVKEVLNISMEELEKIIEQRKVKTADIITSKNCNRDCNQCFAGEKNGSKINMDMLERKYNEMTSQGYSVFPYPLEVTVEAGEPYYEKLLDLCSNPWKGRLLTNGIVIGRDRRVLRSLRRAVNELNIGNFEGLDEATQKRVTGRADLQETIDGIIAAKEEGFKVGIFSVVNRANLGQVRGLCERAYELGAESIKFYRLLPVGNAKRIRELVPDAKECEEFIRNVFDIRKSFKKEELRISVANNFGPDLYSSTTLKNLADPNYFTKYICFAANPEYVAVELDGDKETTYPCFFLSGEEATANQKPYADFDPSKLKGLCGECDYKRLCGGGCLAVGYAMKGEFYGGMDFCQTKTIEKFDLRGAANE